jgi:hypothetical protein
MIYFHEHLLPLIFSFSSVLIKNETQVMLELIYIYRTFRSLNNWIVNQQPVFLI